MFLKPTIKYFPSLFPLPLHLATYKGKEIHNLMMPICVCDFPKGGGE